jgi:hypothetical protein
MAFITCEVENEIELFDWLAQHNVSWIHADMAADWRYGGHAGFEFDGRYDPLQIMLNDGQLLDLNYEDEDIPAGKELDDTLRDVLADHMRPLVEDYLSRLYTNKEHYEATGDVHFNIPEKTVEMNLLVRIHRTRKRTDIEVKWNIKDLDNPIVNNVRSYKEGKAGVEWEKDHRIWRAFEPEKEEEAA